jgi:hypothetical protein
LAAAAAVVGVGHLGDVGCGDVGLRRSGDGGSGGRQAFGVESERLFVVVFR